MMTVTLAQIKEDQKQAMKNKDSLKKYLLTTLLGESKALADKAAEKEPRDANGAVIKRDPTSDELVETIGKFLKSNRDFQEKVKDENKLVTARSEAAILNSYLPKQLDSIEIEKIVKENFPVIDNSAIGPINKYFQANYKGSYNSSELKAVITKLMK
jgi:uncharacterized protein YqeY